MALVYRVGKKWTILKNRVCDKIDHLIECVLVKIRKLDLNGLIKAMDDEEGDRRRMMIKFTRMCRDIK